MAHLGFMRTVYKAGSNNAIARIAYITGNVVERGERSEERTASAHQGREDVVAVSTGNLPEWAEGKAASYFRAAEQFERASLNDARQRGNAFEEWKILLPHELSREQNVGLIEDLVESIARDRLPYMYAFHAPRTLSGSREQPHIHLLISARMHDGYVRTAATYFKWHNREHPERGGAQKDPAFWHQGAVKAHRVLIADVLNIHLEQQGHPVRLHPDRLQHRGFRRAPEPKLWPKESQAYREREEVSRRLARVHEVRRDRADQRSAENVQAWQYWEQRKAVLGITRDMVLERQIARIRVARQHVVQQALERTSPTHERRARTPEPSRQRGLRWDRGHARWQGHGQEDMAREGVHVRVYDGTWERERP